MRVANGTDEAEIRQLVDHWARALHARNIEALPWAQAPGGAFELERWFASWPGSEGREMRYLRFPAQGVAYCHSLSRIGSGMWVRAIVALRKIEGKWQVTRELVSPLPPADCADGAATAAQACAGGQR